MRPMSDSEPVVGEQRASNRRRSGPMLAKIRRFRRTEAKDGPISPRREVQWQLAEDYAAAVDDARESRDWVKLQRAATDLQALMNLLESGPSDANPGPAPGGADLYTLPPVGHTTDAG